MEAFGLVTASQAIRPMTIPRYRVVQSGHRPAEPSAGVTLVLALVGAPVAIGVGHLPRHFGLFARVTGVSPLLARVRTLESLTFARLRRALAFIGAPFSFVSSELTDVCDPVPLRCDAISLVGKPFPP